MATAIERLALSELNVPTRFEVVDFELSEEESIRLKVLGICQGREVQLIQPGSPMVLNVCGSNVGVSRRLARGIIVQPK